MSTNAMIGIQTKDGIRAVYCHWDGNPEVTGATLQEHWGNPLLAADLLSGGDMSALGTDMDDCVFYHRDKKEPFKPATLYGSTIEMFDDSWSNIEFFYVMEPNGTWWVSDHRSDFVPLADALA